MTEPRPERCFCCIHVNDATVAIAVIQMISSFIWSVICFITLYMSQTYLHLPSVVHDFVLYEYGASLGDHFVFWTFLTTIFVSAIFVLIGHSKQNSRWYWPTLVANTIMIGRYVELQIVYVIDHEQTSTYFWAYFLIVIFDIYFTLMVYKGKSYLDWLQMERTQAKQMDDLMMTIHESDGYHFTRDGTAPPLSENNYYVLN